MYARGMTTRDIQGHLQEIYGIDVSPALISQVTDAISEEVLLWQNRSITSWANPYRGSSVTYENNIERWFRRFLR